MDNYLEIMKTNMEENMSRKFVDEKAGLVIAYHLPQQHDAKYLVVVVDRVGKKRGRL